MAEYIAPDWETMNDMTKRDFDEFMNLQKILEGQVKRSGDEISISILKDRIGTLKNSLKLYGIDVPDQPLSDSTQALSKSNYNDTNSKVDKVTVMGKAKYGDTKAVQAVKNEIEKFERENDVTLSDEEYMENLDRNLDNLTQDCIAEWDGKTLGLTGASLIAAGQPLISTRGKLRNATKGTSVASVAGRAVDNLTNNAMKIPGKGNNSVTLRGFSRAPTLGAWAGRATPYVGWGLAGMGAGIYSGCNKKIKG